ncbi:heterokaryon incompatibility protein-domain-containing protein [Trametes polyzona]|nr:heterokaryon incompatibility protein-domain-containing protein [Trametes polyzona]
MWLLSTTSRLELRFFDRPDQVKGGYAILSHVWQDYEQTFQDIQELSALEVTFDDDSISDKIQGCIRAAKAYGLHWLWIDASCIDKTSSAELSEAINSMYAWYAQARICFAYLHDVPDSCDLNLPTSAFRRSKWFTRGWTLQELVAPKCLIFLSEDWTYLGTKATLAPLLMEITGIDVEILISASHRKLQQVSVARRMSWAAGRETTRVEDEAYSLMGLFGITMPTIYGEGTDAFRRLQEEIMKQVPDQTLFAWGKALPLDCPRFRLSREIEDQCGSLFASSPRDFAQSGEYRPVTGNDVAKAVQTSIDVSQDERSDSEFVITNVGVRCRLIVVDCIPFVIAVLACQTASGDCVGLLLHQLNDAQEDCPQYVPGALCSRGLGAPGRALQPLVPPERYRLFYITPASLSVLFGREDAPVGSPLRTVPGIARRLYIIHNPSVLPMHPWTRLREPEPQRIIIPPWFSAQIARHNFLPENFPDCLTPDDGVVCLRLKNHGTNETVVVHLERYCVWLCAYVTILPPPHLATSPHYLPQLDHQRLPPPRAFEEDSLGDGSHPSTLQNYIRFWKNGTKVFGDAARTVRLTFTRWPDPDCYCLDVVLEGCVYASQEPRLPSAGSMQIGGAAARKSLHRRAARETKAALLASHYSTHIGLRTRRRLLATQTVAAYVNCSQRRSSSVMTTLTRVTVG